MCKIITFSVLLSSLQVFACLNYSVVGTDVHGKKVHTDGDKFFSVEISSFDRANFIEKAKSDMADYQKTKNLDSYLDYATSLVYLGEYDKAIKIFKEIDKINPRKYEVASNLGTAYELIGENSNALKWIKRALELNKDSHHGSEWIHVKILEKKLGLIKMDNFLGVDFGGQNIPTSSYSKDQLEDLVFDLSYQLSERSQFVKPQDEIVGRLFYDFGNALSLTYDLESAKKAYEISKQYGYKNPLLQKRIDYYGNLIKSNKDSGKHIDIVEVRSEVKQQEQIKPDFKNTQHINEPESKLPLILVIGIISGLIILLIVIKRNRK